MKKIIIIGFGNQAKAWALNLKDSGWEVKIGLRPCSTSIPLAQDLGFQVFDYTQEASLNSIESTQTQFIAILTPDETHYEIVQLISQRRSFSPTFIYAHGYSLLYTKLSELPVNHVLLAPKAIASELRYEFETKGKNGGVYSFEYLQDSSQEKAILNLALDLGLTSLHEASIKDETIADLFSEQVLLCSTLPYAAVHSFNKLREAGISQEVAFFECWHEVKLIANTMVKLGPEKFFDLISPNALLGSEVGKSTLFNHEYQKKLDDILNHIITGNFAEDMNKPNFDSHFSNIKTDVMSFWKAQELNQVHQRMESDLY